MDFFKTGSLQNTFQDYIHLIIVTFITRKMIYMLNILRQILQESQICFFAWDYSIIPNPFVQDFAFLCALCYYESQRLS